MRPINQDTERNMLHIFQGLEMDVFAVLHKGTPRISVLKTYLENLAMRKRTWRSSVIEALIRSFDSSRTEQRQRSKLIRTFAKVDEDLFYALVRVQQRLSRQIPSCPQLILESEMDYTGIHHWDTDFSAEDDDLPQQLNSYSGFGDTSSHANLVYSFSPSETAVIAERSLRLFPGSDDEGPHYETRDSSPSSYSRSSGGASLPTTHPRRRHHYHRSRSDRRDRR